MKKNQKLSDDRFYLDLSTIPDAGLGLFAKRDISIGEYMVYYGYIYSKIEKMNFSKGYKHSKYVYEKQDGTMIDCKEFYDCAARYINDGPQSGIQPNVKWVENNSTRYVLVVFTKNVRKGEEIFISYGSQYWQKE